MTFAGPHKTFAGPRMTSAGPRTISTGARIISSELPVNSGTITFAGPDTTNARPQTTSAGPRITSAGSRVTSAKPNMCVISDGAHSTSARLPVTSAGPNIMITDRAHSTSAPCTISTAPRATSTGAHTTTAGPRTTCAGPCMASARPHTVSTGPRTTSGGLCTTSSSRPEVSPIRFDGSVAAHRATTVTAAAPLNAPGTLNTCHVPTGSTSAVAQRHSTTPSRTGYVSHVQPVTLLPPGAEFNQGHQLIGGFYGAHKEFLAPKPCKASGLSSVSPDVLLRRRRASADLVRSPTDGEEAFFDEVEWTNEASMFPEQSPVSSPARSSPNVIEETPPLAQGGGQNFIPGSQTFRTPTLAFRNKSKISAANLTHKYVSPTPADVVSTHTASPHTSIRNEPSTSISCSALDKFKTPSATRWLTEKQRNNSPSPGSQTSTPSPSSSVFVSKGGKITPPLCSCGRRAKRKVVGTPGPNEGKPFYVCPNSKCGDRRQGCSYFQWEQQKADKDSSSFVKPLLSDYGE